MAAAVTSPTSSNVGNEEQTWKSFAENVSGEWEGITATFSPAGQPQPLPEHYVPEAFREWGVELWDWQSQCSSLAVPAAAGKPEIPQLRSVLRRLMPTVGCEADAIAFTEEEACSGSSSDAGDIGSSDTAGQGIVYAADGSYSLGPALLPPISKDNGPSKFQVEHCLVLPADVTGSAEGANSGRTVRVKIVQQFRRNWSTGVWLLGAVDLHKERFDGPYTGKRELAGCGGGQLGIAQLPVLQANQLKGSWVADTANTSSLGGVPLQQLPRLSCLDSTGPASEQVQLTLLPLQAWSAVQLDDKGQLQRAEAGVLLQRQQQEGSDGAVASSTSCNTRAVSVCVYDADTGRLQAARIGQESRA